MTLEDNEMLKQHGIDPTNITKYQLVVLLCKILEKVSVK